MNGSFYAELSGVSLQVVSFSPGMGLKRLGILYALLALVLCASCVVVSWVIMCNYAYIGLLIPMRLDLHERCRACPRHRCKEETS